MKNWRYAVSVLFLAGLLSLPLFAQSGPGGGHGPHRHGHGTMTAERQNFTNYRGQRKPVESSAFYMETFSSKEDGDVLIIDITFNQEVDPRSVKVENIEINGVQVSDAVRFSFNREGRRMRISMEGGVTYPFSFTIRGIKSYNGRQLDGEGIDGVNRSESYSYSEEGNSWQKY